MTDYKNIFGKPVKFLATDPDNAEAEGQIWYNSTDGVFKDLIISEAWSAAGPLGSGRYALGQGTGGTVDAGIAVFGRKGGPAVNSTEEYNGSGWSTGGNGNTARYACAKFGTQTAAVAAGGKITGPSVQNVEEYNGTSWSEETDYPSTARAYLAGFGILTAGVICGGNTGSPDTWYTLTEEYDGSSWTTGGAMNNARGAAGTTGILTAGLVFGGFQPSLLAKTEEYNGTAWTESGDMSTARSHVAGSGTQDAALAYGGFTPSSTTQTEAYNGSTWSTSPATLATATARNSSVGSGASTGLSFGGNPPGTSATEEYNRSVNVITAAAWASGGNLNTARWGLGGAGTKSAGIVFGGRNPPVGQDLALSEQYNGTSWSEGPDLNTATRVCGRGTGTSTAALKHGGHFGSPQTSNKTAEEWDGSSWTNGGASTNNHDGTMQIGTQTAAASCGSHPPTGAKTEEYDGTSWTASNDMPYSAYNGAASGSQTAGVVFGGGYPIFNNSAEYNGTNWTAGNTLLQPTAGHGGNGGSGTQTLAIGAGGYTPGPTYLTAAFTYDGTNFATAPSMATARQEVAAQGANTSFYVAGGLTAPGAASNATEEFTTESSALNIKTITTS